MNDGAARSLSGLPASSDRGLLVLRIGFLVLLVGLHGGTRFLRAFEYAVWGEPWTFVGLVAQLGFPLAPLFAVLSALSESVGAVLVGIGLFTRWAAAVIVVNFVVAVVNEAAGGQSVELAALYLLVALVIAVTGPGAYAVDGLWARRSRSPRPSTDAPVVARGGGPAARVA